MRPQRVSNLKNESFTSNKICQKKSTTDAGNDGKVDKAVEAVVGGFVGKAIEELESLVGTKRWK